MEIEKKGSRPTTPKDSWSQKLTNKLNEIQNYKKMVDK